MARRVSSHKPPLVEVEWTDATDIAFNGTVEEAKTKKLACRFQAGYLVHQNENVTILAQTYDPANEEGDEATVERLTLIPTGWVISIRHRRQRRPKKPNAESPVETTTEIREETSR